MPYGGLVEHAWAEEDSEVIALFPGLRTDLHGPIMMAFLRGPGGDTERWLVPAGTSIACGTRPAGRGRWAR